MKVCPRCSHSNSERAMYCGNCGARLTKPAGETIPVRPRTALLDPRGLAAAQLGKAPAQPEIPEGASLRVHFSTEPKPVLIPLKPELIIGRRDPALPRQPDIDLSPYSGYRMGISRHHAKISYKPDGELLLVDLGSSNGTFLNGARLAVHHSYHVDEGDEIRLGQLIMVVYHDTAKSSEKSSKKTLADVPEKRTLSTLPMPGDGEKKSPFPEKAISKPGIESKPKSDKPEAVKTKKQALAQTGELSDNQPKEAKKGPDSEGK